MRSHSRGIAALAVSVGLAVAAVIVMPPAMALAGASGTEQPLPAAYRADFDVTAIRASGHPDNRYDIVIAGEGFASDDISDHFAVVAERLADCFLTSGQFDREPYLRYRNFINVHRVDAMSNDSGSDTAALDRDTARSNSGFVDRISIMEQSTRRAGFAPDARLANAARGIGFAGTGWAETNDACEPALHESGHAWNGLGDEFDIQSEAKPCVEPVQPNLTIESSPQRVKWRRWLGYQPAGDMTLGPIGVYGLATTCLKRPLAGTDNSRMWRDGPFTAIDREAIIRSIYTAARPVDAATPTDATLSDPKLWVRVVDPAVIKVAWSVIDAKGTAIATSTGQVLDTTALRLAKGSYRVTARAYDAAVDHAFSDRSPATIDGSVQRSPDALDLVRDPTLLSAMQQSISWNVTVTGASSSVAPLAATPTAITLTADRSSRAGATVGWLGNLGTGVTRVVGLPPAFAVTAAGQVVVKDSAWLRSTALGTRSLTVSSVDPLTGASTTQALTLIVADHWLNTIDDRFEDNVVDADLAGGRGFRRFDGESGGSITESGGSLHLVGAEYVTASARSIETVDIRRGGVNVAWTVAPPMIGQGGSVTFGLFDNVVGVRRGGLVGSDVARGVRVVLAAAGSLVVETVASGVVTKLAQSTVTLSSPSTEIVLGIDVLPGSIKYSVRVGSTDVASGSLPADMLQKIVTVDDGPWGRKSQAVTTRVAGQASLDVAQVRVTSRSTWVRPVVTFPIGAQTVLQGQPYRFDSSRYVLDARIRPFTITAAGLPPGLVANGRGLVTGAPTTSGSFNSRIVVSLPDGTASTLEFTINVVASTNPTIVPVPTVHFRLDGDSFESGGRIGGNTWARSSSPVGAPTYAAGVDGAALVSSPTSGVLLRSHPGLFTGNASTYSMWLKANTPAPTTAMFPLVRDYQRNRITIRLVLATGAVADLAVQMTHQPALYADSPPTPQPLASAAAQAPNFLDGRWHHVATVFDGRTLTVYVDGQEIASAPAEGRAVTLGRDSGDLEIGGRPDAFVGLVDDVQVWDSPLTAGQVAVLATSRS